MTKLTSLAAAFAAIAIVGGAGVAHASDDSMRVRIGDLNTSSDQGAQTALRRIKAAANRFCGPSTPGLSQYADQKSCVKRMTDKAVAQLDAPRVTALYHPKSRPIELAQSGTAGR